MKKRLSFALAAVLLAAPARAERLGYHEIQVDAAGRMVPWCSADPARAYDQVIGLVWGFWKNLGTCSNGIPYFFQHQVWKPEHDPRGLGGDQLAMALSSLNLLYEYSGDPASRQMMVGIANYCLERGFSGPGDAWPGLPFPYNCDLHSGRYDGDMRAGKGFLQPDKAGSLGIELLTLYEMTGTNRYLEAAVGIADTLAAKATPGDADHSPWPFRVHARTGELSTNTSAAYTANWTGTLRLFDELIRLRQGRTPAYEAARQTLGAWLKAYPMKLNKWGPFFEDVAGWSDTEINADTLAWYILEHPQWDSHWRQDARAILDWSLATFATNRWAAYGVTAIQEQTQYRVPGNSHTSRHASVELIYCEKTGDTSHQEEAIRQLNWATYSVDVDGKNRYPNDDIWLTDGYGDYLRHYLRAMAATPRLATSGHNHLLRCSSVIQEIHYETDAVTYRTFDTPSRERLQVMLEAAEVTAGGVPLKQVSRAEDLDHEDGYVLETTGTAKGRLEIRHSHAKTVVIRRKENR